MTAPTPSPDPRDGIAWMNGSYMPIQDAKISVLDWGFIHSDVTYDVVTVWDGAFFRLEDHLDRFFASMEALHLSMPETRSELAQILHGCVARTTLQESYVAMVCSRGRVTIPGSRDPRDCANHLIAYALPFIWVPKPDETQGLSMAISVHSKRTPPDSINPEIKNYHWGDFTIGLFEAKTAGFDTVLLCDHQGYVTEGPGFNVFCVQDNTIITPRHGHLMGISRRTVIEIAEEKGYKVEQRPLPPEELLAADEVFLSTSGGGVRPVTRVNQTIFSNGAPGPVATKMQQTYWQWRATGRHTTPVNYDVAGNSESFLSGDPADPL